MPLSLWFAWLTRAAHSPYNGAVTVTFASSRVKAKVGLVQDTYTWKFSGDMAAQDGRWAPVSCARVLALALATRQRARP